MNPVAPALSLFTPEELAGFMRRHVADPVGQTIADFIVVTRMRGSDFVRMPQEDLEVLTKGLLAVTELLASFQVLTVIPSPRPVWRIQDIFPWLSTSSSTNPAEQLTSEDSDLESNYWSSRSSSPDSLPSVEPKSNADDSDHDISSHSVNTPFPLLSPQASPLRPAQLMTALSVRSDLIAHHDDFAFYSVDDDELRSLYPVFITPPIATVYQEPAAHETPDVSLQDSPVDDTMRPPTRASTNDPSPSTSSSASHRTANRISHFSTNTLTSNDVVPDISQLEEINVSESEWPDNISTPDVHTLNKDASSVAVGNDVDAVSDEPQDLPSLDCDASPRTVTIHDHTEPSSPFLYNSHDNLPALAVPSSGGPSFDSPHHSPMQTVTPHQIEIIDIRPWNLTSKPPSLSILFPISLEGSSWGRSGSSAVLNPTDLAATQSLCSTTSTAASFFALQVPRDWLSEDPEQIDESPGPQAISRFRHNFSDRTGPLSPIHGESDDEVDEGEIGSLDLEGSAISPSLPLNIPSCSLLDDDEISPLLFSPPSRPTRSHTNNTPNETPHNRKLFLDTTERTLWPSGSVAYHRRRALSSPTVVKRALKIPSGSSVASPNVASPLSGLSAANSGIDRKLFLESPTTRTPNIWWKQLRKQLRSLGTSRVQSPPSLKRTQSLLSPRTKIEITDSRLLPIIHGPLSATEHTPVTTSPSFA